MNLCKDCKFYKNTSGWTQPIHRCTRTDELVTDLVTGGLVTITPMRDTKKERDRDGECGHAGKYFEAIGVDDVRWMRFLIIVGLVSWFAGFIIGVML